VTNKVLTHAKTPVLVVNAQTAWCSWSCSRMRAMTVRREHHLLEHICALPDRTCAGGGVAALATGARRWFGSSARRDESQLSSEHVALLFDSGNRESM